MSIVKAENGGGGNEQGIQQLVPCNTARRAPTLSRPLPTSGLFEEGILVYRTTHLWRQFRGWSPRVL